MFKNIHIPRIYFGWWLTIAVSFFFTLTAGFGSQGASVIFKPLSTDLGLDRASTSIAMGIAALQNGIFFPLAGWLCDRYGSKYLAIAGCCITGTGLILMNFIQYPWQYYLIWGVLIGGGSTLGFSVSIDKVVANWFIKKRGLAFSIRFVIAAVVGMILLPVISLLVTELGWRTAALVWSIVAFGTIPVAFYFVKEHTPEYYGWLPDGEKPEREKVDGSDKDLRKIVSTDFGEQDFTLSQALKTSTYWLLTIVWVLYFAVSGGISVHLIPMFTDYGITPVKAASLVALMAFFGLPSRFLSGILADRFGKQKLRYLLAGILALMALGIWSMTLNIGIYTKVYLFLIFFGLGYAGFVPLDIMIRSRFYGRKAYGSIQSLSMIFSAPISFCAPIFSGWVYDNRGSYSLAFIVYGILATCAVIFTLMLKVPELPQKNQAYFSKG